MYIIGNRWHVPPGIDNLFDDKNGLFHDTKMEAVVTSLGARRTGTISTKSYGLGTPELKISFHTWGYSQIIHFNPF